MVHLNKEIHDAEQEIVGLLRDGGDGAGNDQADVGSTTLERDHEMSLANNAREMLDQIERALARIEDGTYGVCESCGNAIGKGRLQAFRVRHCACHAKNAKNAAERPRLVPPAGDAPRANGTGRPRVGRFSVVSGPHAAPPTDGESWKLMLLFGGVGLLILFLDQLTKALALQHLTPGEPVNVIRSLLKFNLIRNSGRRVQPRVGYTPYISAVQITVAIGVIYLSRKLGSVGWAVAFGLLFGGAVGNIIDRIFREPSPFHGHVIDFLQTPHWAIFNIADMAVTSAAPAGDPDPARGQARRHEEQRK